MATKTAPRTEPKPASKTARKTARTAAKPADAIKLLKDDHAEVKKWFKQYESLEDDGEKQALADQICLALTVHAQIEEEIFYPAAREAIDDDDLLDEAEVEHASAKQLIAEIQSMKAGDRLFDARLPCWANMSTIMSRKRKRKCSPKAGTATSTSRRSASSLRSGKPS